MKTFATLFLAATLAFPVLADRAFTDSDGNTGVLHDTACTMKSGEGVPDAKAFSLTLNGKALKGCYIEDGDFVIILLEDGAMLQMPSQVFE